jgi:hypothetical protein
VSTVTVATAITTIAAAVAATASRVDWGWTITWIRWLLVTWVF